MWIFQCLWTFASVSVPARNLSCQLYDSASTVGRTMARRCDIHYKDKYTSFVPVREILCLHLFNLWISDTRYTVSTHTKHSVSEWSWSRWQPAAVASGKQSGFGCIAQGHNIRYGHRRAMFNHFNCPHFSYCSGIKPATLCLQATLGSLHCPKRCSVSSLI